MRNWFGGEVVPQMRTILASFYGDPILGFRELARRGWFDDAVEEWHAAPEGTTVADLELHEHLGLSWQEYRLIFAPSDWPPQPL